MLFCANIRRLDFPRALYVKFKDSKEFKKNSFEIKMDFTMFKPCKSYMIGAVNDNCPLFDKCERIVQWKNVMFLPTKFLPSIFQNANVKFMIQNQRHFSSFQNVDAL